jgi:hypothetical protein
MNDKEFQMFLMSVEKGIDLLIASSIKEEAYQALPAIINGLFKTTKELYNHQIKLEQENNE